MERTRKMHRRSLRLESRVHGRRATPCMLKARAEKLFSARSIWISRQIPSTARLPGWLGWVGRTDQAAQNPCYGPAKTCGSPPAEEPTSALARAPYACRYFTPLDNVRSGSSLDHLVGTA